MIVRNNVTMNVLPNIYKRGIVPSFQNVLSIPNFNWLVKISPNVLTRKLNNILIDGIIGYVPAEDSFNFIIPPGIVCIQGIPIFTKEVMQILPPNTDTYVDIYKDGTPIITPVPRGAAQPGATPGSLRTQIATTSSNGIIDVRNVQITSINYLDPVINAAYSNIDFTMRPGQQILIPFQDQIEVNIPVTINENQLYSITVLTSPNAIEGYLNTNGVAMPVTDPTAFSPYYSFVSYQDQTIKTAYIQTLKQPTSSYYTLTETPMGTDTTMGTLSFNQSVSGFALISLIEVREPKFTPQLPAKYFFSDGEDIGSANSLPI